MLTSTFLICFLIFCIVSRQHNLVESASNIVGGWQQTQLPSGVSADIIGISCMNSTNCLLVGTQLSVTSISYILMTKDGGFTWSTVYSLTAQASSGVYIVGSLYGVTTYTTSNKVYGVTICTTGEVVVSTDSGKSWITNSAKLPATILGISTGSNGQGFIVGYIGKSESANKFPVVFTSSDTLSYAKWTQVNITSTKGNIANGVSTVDGIFVVAVGSGPSIYYSDNSGISWKSASSSAQSLCSGATLYSVAVAPNNAFVIVAGSSGCVLKSINGSIWTLVTSSYINSNTDYKFQSISITNSNDIYLAGSKGIISYSYDSGNTWQFDFTSSNDPNNAIPIYSIYMTRQQAGIAGLGLTGSTSSNNVYIRFPYPSAIPTYNPSASPSIEPSFLPTTIPTLSPSSIPSKSPTNGPTCIPTRIPTVKPTMGPSCSPTRWPSSQPSSQPSRIPSANPLRVPSSIPSQQPVDYPTKQPYSVPTQQPIRYPSKQPSSCPSRQPSRQPVVNPSSQPSSQPMKRPSKQPTLQPSSQPSLLPRSKPTSQPYNQPSNQPSSLPTLHPISTITSGVWFEIPKVASSFITTTVYYKSSVWISSQIVVILGGSLSSSGSSQNLGVILISKNGGTSWSKSLVVQAAVFQEMSYIKLSSKSYLVAVDNRGNVYSSLDNGLTWPYNTSVSSSVALNSVTIGKSGIAFTIGGSKIFKSSNNSNYYTWTEQLNTIDISAVTLNDLRITSYNTLVIVGSGGFVGICQFSVTSNIISCQRLPFGSVGTSTSLFGLTFLGDNLFGFMTGTDGSILKTLNGGFNWIKLSSSVISTGIWNLGILGRVISIVAKSLVFAVDSYGHVFLSKNGGFTWSNETLVAKTASKFSLYNINMRSSGYGIIGGSVGNVYLKTSAPSSQPSSKPSNKPSSQPSFIPNGLPTTQPFHLPSSQPLARPSCQPTTRPTGPTKTPVVLKSVLPSIAPSYLPTPNPSKGPTTIPTRPPTSPPSTNPSWIPSVSPSKSPTYTPSGLPTYAPSPLPTYKPSFPTITPSFAPSSLPSMIPSNPTVLPTTASPSIIPISISPTIKPSYTPSSIPSMIPFNPTMVPTTASPSITPVSVSPSYTNTAAPSLPTITPSYTPSTLPSLLSSNPTVVPTTASPSYIPISITPSYTNSAAPSSTIPTISPSKLISSRPSYTSSPSSRTPSAVPSLTVRTTNVPTVMPSYTAIISFSQYLVMVINGDCNSIDIESTKAITLTLAQAMKTSPQYIQYVDCRPTSFSVHKSLKGSVPVQVTTVTNVPISTYGSDLNQNALSTYSQLYNSFTSIDYLTFSINLRAISTQLNAVGTSSSQVISGTSSIYKVIILQPSYEPTLAPSSTEPTAYLLPPSTSGSSSELNSTMLVIIIVFSVLGGLLIIIIASAFYCYLESKKKESHYLKEVNNNNKNKNNNNKETREYSTLPKKEESKSDTLNMDKIYSNNKESSFQSDSFRSPEYVSRKDLLGSKSTGSTNMSNRVDIYYQNNYLSPSTTSPVSPRRLRTGSPSKSTRSPEERSERKAII